MPHNFPSSLCDLMPPPLLFPCPYIWTMLFAIPIAHLQPCRKPSIRSRRDTLSSSSLSALKGLHRTRPVTRSYRLAHQCRLKADFAYTSPSHSTRPAKDRHLHPSPAIVTSASGLKARSSYASIRTSCLIHTGLKAHLRHVVLQYHHISPHTVCLCSLLCSKAEGQSKH